MIRLSETKEIICDEQGKVLRESGVTFFLSEQGIFEGKAEKFFYCESCGSLIKSIEAVSGRCSRCGRLCCDKCSSYCEGSLVCKNCCYVAAHNISEADRGIYCFSCKLRYRLGRGIRKIFQKLKSTRGSSAGRLPAGRNQ